jgi:HD superfamily phosphohydrolase
MATHRDIRDPIHGFIRIEGRECDIVDSPVFQRLRHVRQLAMAYLVYPSATHSRFEHTLGVMHVAGRMCERLRVDSPHTQTIRFAALLHDVGHGPFSHPSEEVLAAVAPADVKEKAGGLDKIHELITRRIILTDPDLRKLVADKDREQIVSLLDHGLDQPLFKSIVSGALDADKQDYLLRDSYACGVRYGVFDLERLHGVLARDEGPDGSQLVVEDDGLHTLEQFVLARYFLTTQVIRHRGRLITDHMLVRGLKLGVQVDQVKFLEKLYTYEDSDDFCQEYLSWNDERLMSKLLESEYAETWAGRTVRRLFQRRLYKCVFQRPIESLAPTIGLEDALRPVMREIEEAVADALSSETGQAVAPEEVILDVIKAPPAKKSEGSVLLKSERGERRTFEDASVIFRSIDQTLQAASLQCYAPMADLDEAKRRKAEARVAEVIVNSVQKLAVETPKPAQEVEQSHGD